jgi:DNA-binding CsgD family transcriptional regulator
MIRKPHARWDLDAISTAFASAALDSGKWVEAMDVIAGETGSAGAVLLPIAVQGAMPHVPFSSSLESLVEPYFKEGWIERDLRRRAVPLLLKDRVFSELHYTTDEEMRTEPFFQEYLGPRGFRWSAVVLMSAGDDAWAVSIQRHLTQDPFSPNELTQLQGLSMRLCSAAATARALGFARGEAALCAFDASDTAVILLDRFGRAVRMNGAAEDMIGPDLQVVDKKLRPKDPESAKVLYRTFREVIWESTDTRSLGLPFGIARTGRRPLLAYLSRHAGISADVFSPIQAVLILVDPERRAQPAIATLKVCYGLTDAEARLAAYFTSGASLDAAAASFGVSRTTVRNQLASVMAKVGVNRQAELVAALAALRSKSKMPAR